MSLLRASLSYLALPFLVFLGALGFNDKAIGESTPLKDETAFGRVTCMLVPASNRTMKSKIVFEINSRSFV